MTFKLQLLSGGADLAGDTEMAGTRPAEVQLTLFVEDALRALRLVEGHLACHEDCLLYTSPSPRDS